MKRFVFELVIEEGSDEFWESLEKLPVETAIGDVRKLVMDTLSNNGITEVLMTPIKFEETFD